ncbi:MAG: PilZ domain-containing protein [Spirochaetes bacterium]|nr:PilZ domain-containing protein [Spirochaetota bacterium]
MHDINKRKHGRIEKKILVWYQTTYSKGDFSFGKEVSVDISAGGIQMEMEDIDSPGTELMMKFQVPNHARVIEAKGEVVWTRRLNAEKYLVGVKFIEISEFEREIINRMASSG